MQPNMSKVNVAVVGAGRMGLTHYAIINAHPDVRVCGVVEPSTAVRAVLGKYSDAPQFADLEKMMLACRPDALLVSTPPASHAEILSAGLERRLHVFVEKPCTTTAADARRFAELYDAAGLVHQVGYVNRFNDVFAEVRRLMRAKTLGEIVRYRTEMLSRTVTSSNVSSGWRQTRKSGGGVTYEMAAHAIDLTGFLFGAADRVAGSRMTKVFSQAVEDIVSTTLVHPAGLTGTLFVNWCDESVRKPTNMIEILGTRGKIIANQHGMNVYLNETSQQAGLPAGWSSQYITALAKPVPFYVRGNEFTRQLWYFIDRIRDRSLTSMCSMHDAADTLSLIERMFADPYTHDDAR
jgi:predicted dehydrogenase